MADEDGKPPRDWSKTLDLDRKQLTRDLVEQMEDAMRRRQVANDDLKTICASAAEQEFNPNKIAAMKTVARLQLQDKVAEAKEKLSALEEVSIAVECDLF